MLIYRGSFSVFSTSVEVILGTWRSQCPARRILHECGGDPLVDQCGKSSVWYSPRVWRWSLGSILPTASATVFSTSVEVILYHFLSLIDQSGILHECGGDPTPEGDLVEDIQYSPRVWRWSYLRFLIKSNDSVFSTSVEVIPLFAAFFARLFRILHECGGDPLNHDHHQIIEWYSPRVWRWSKSLHQPKDGA